MQHFRHAFVTLACVAAGSLPSAQSPAAPAPPPAPAVAANRADLDPAVFHEALAPYGRWTTLAPWGEVWVPTGEPAGWRPYTTGSWAWSDDCGWTWCADEPWGWAPFHYGRWTLDPTLGWCWVPGAVWGPAWVAWRAGDGFDGWAPLPPAVRWEAGIGLAFGDVDLALSLYDPWWTFVPVASFCHPHVREVILPPERVVNVIHRTVVVHDTIVVERGRPVHRPIAVAAVERARGAPVPRVAVRDVDRLEGLDTAPRPGELAVYRPHLRAPKVGDRHAAPAPAERSRRAEPLPAPHRAPAWEHDLPRFRHHRPRPHGT